MDNILNHNQCLDSWSITEDFDFTDMSDTDYTNTFSDMDDTIILIKEWCDKHIKFGKVSDYDADRMTTYSGRYVIDPSSHMISILFDEHTPVNNTARFYFGVSESFRNGRQVQIVDDATDPKGSGSNKWTGGDFPDYIRFDICDGDFIVTNYSWYACPPMTFCGFPVTINGRLSVNIGLRNSNWFNDNQTVVNGWNNLPSGLDLTGLPTKICSGISFTNCGLSSIKGMPALKSDSADSVRGVDIDFGSNKLRNLDGINLSGNPKINRFIVDDNMLESLSGSPERINGNCDVSNNCLTLLVGMPKYIGGDFNCYNNFLKKSTVISRLSTVNGRKYGLNQQKKNPATPTRKKVNENFDFSNMSDVDYTDTFSDIDQMEKEKHIIKQAFAGISRRCGFMVIDNEKMYRKIKQIIEKKELYGEFDVEKTESYIIIHFSSNALVHMTTLNNNELYIDPCILFGGDRHELGISNIRIWITPKTDSIITAREYISVSANTDRFELNAEPNENGNFIGMPYKVVGNVKVDNDKSDIRSLEGCPSEITGDFEIIFKRRQSKYPTDFTGCPETVGSEFCVFTYYGVKNVKMKGSGLPLFAGKVNLCYIDVPIVFYRKIQPLCQDGLNRKFNHLVFSKKSWKINHDITDAELDEIIRDIDIPKREVEFRG